MRSVDSDLVVIWSPNFAGVGGDVGRCQIDQNITTSLYWAMFGQDLTEPWLSDAGMSDIKLNDSEAICLLLSFWHCDWCQKAHEGVRYHLVEPSSWCRCQSIGFVFQSFAST